MTIQFSKKPIAVISGGLPKMGQASSNEGRLQACKAWRAGVNPARHRIVDARTSRYAETYARWQRDPGGIGGARRAKGVSA